MNTKKNQISPDFSGRWLFIWRASGIAGCQGILTTGNPESYLGIWWPWNRERLYSYRRRRNQRTVCWLLFPEHGDRIWINWVCHEKIRYQILWAIEKNTDAMVFSDRRKKVRRRNDRISCHDGTKSRKLIVSNPDNYSCIEQIVFKPTNEIIQRRETDLRYQKNR